MKINLGCGRRKLEGFVNIDISERMSPDILADLSDSIPFKDGSVDEVSAIDFLEHIPIGRTIRVIEEIHRVLKNGGKFFSMTPSTDGRGAFQDPTHVSFWNKNSWLYYMDDAHRDLYGIKAKFKGQVDDVQTSSAMWIVHTRAMLYAVK